MIAVLWALLGVVGYIAVAAVAFVYREDTWMRLLPSRLRHVRQRCWRRSEGDPRMSRIRLRCLLGLHSYGPWGPVFIRYASRFQDRECAHCCKIRERIL